jgi:Aldehyde dehydrogenase family
MDAALVQLTSVRDEALDILSRLGAPESAFAREGVMALSPITGELIAQVRITSPEEVSTVIGRATQAFNAWRTVPAPRRGEFVRVLAEELRAAKDDLGRLVTLETGKIVSEGLGEVQEMIDICDFAVEPEVFSCAQAFLTHPRVFAPARYSSDASGPAVCNVEHSRPARHDPADSYRALRLLLYLSPIGSPYAA